MKARVLFGVFGFAFVLLALYVFPPIVLELVLVALAFIWSRIRRMSKIRLKKAEGAPEELPDKTEK